MIIEKLITSIMGKFPGDTITITIKLDGSSSHNVDDDMDVFRAITETNLPIRLTKKPPQIPDLKLLDLRNSTSIQGLHHKKYCEDVKDLVTTVKELF